MNEHVQSSDRVQLEVNGIRRSSVKVQAKFSDNSARTSTRMMSDSTSHPHADKNATNQCHGTRAHATCESCFCCKPSANQLRHPRFETVNMCWCVSAPSGIARQSCAISTQASSTCAQHARKQYLLSAALKEPTIARSTQAIKST